MTNIQFSLFDNSGNQSANSSEIAWIDIGRLHPHPDNPRLIYREDIIETIANSIKENGFQPCYALLVRPFGEGYQVISGHTRLKASQKVGIAKLPCWIKELDDKSARAELRRANNQGELSYRERAQHTFLCVRPTQGKAGGKAEDGTFDSLEAYAKDQNISRVTASEEYKVGELNNELRRMSDEVYDRVNQHESETGKSLGSHQLSISKAPRQYWQQLTELLIENEWSVKQTEAIVNAVKSIEIPDYLHFWLDPEKAIKKTIAEAVAGEEVRTPRDIYNWVKAVEEQLPGLPDNRKINLFDEEEDKEEVQYIDLQAEFLNRLPSLSKGDKKPSVKNIEKLAVELLRWVDELDNAYKRWKEAKASDEARLKQEEEDRRKEIERRIKYAPTGINKDLREMTLEDIGSDFDAIITDVPYLLSNGGYTVRSGKEASVDKNFDDSRENAILPEQYLPLFFEALKPGGVFVTTCTIHVLPDLIQSAIACGFDFRQKLVWFKPNSPPLLSADRFTPDYEDILVFAKPGAAPYFGYEEIMIDGKQRGATITINQCGGKERLGWHDTQKPLALYELLVSAYAPSDGKVLEPFAGTGTTAIACKKLGRICTWVERDPSFFDRTNERIEKSPYFWEA